MGVPGDLTALFPGRLLRWYAARKRDLPWRRTKDPYRIWVSEIMLQQTTVGAVIPYYRKWLAAYPKLQAFARAPQKQILKNWEGLGYYQRVRNMHRAAEILIQSHSGRFPENPEILAELPGFGPYTTAAVASICFGRPLPVIDANVRRVMMRLLGLHLRSGPEADKRILAVLEKGISRRSPGNFNQAMMEWGALICRPRNPLCLRCPGRPFCRAYADGDQEMIPAPKKTPSKRVEAVVAVLWDRGRVLIQKRPERGLLAGLWEFPGGKVEPGESHRYALSREIREELGAEIQDAAPLITVRHCYTQYRVTLHAYEGKLSGGPAALFGKDRSVRWVPLKSLDRYPFPSGSLKIVRFLQTRSS